MDLEEKVKEFFKKNPNAPKCYSTLDENIFAAEHYATNWARGFKDERVTTHLNAALAKAAGVQTGEAEGNKPKAKGGAPATEDKEALVKRYIELFDKKPNHLTGVDKLKAQIVEKELEVAEAEKLAATKVPAFPADRVEDGQSSEELEAK